ncbi:MAG: hypothetical protein ACI9KE_000399 [Polyangiales bacterium]
MSENEKDAARFSKGDQLAIAHGKSNVGVRGEIFWTGANKYGPGFRYGLKDENGETYWVDEADLGPIEGAPPAPARKAAPTGPAKDPIAKGATVEITSGKEGVGQSGEVFWTGDSKFGQGMRYGVKTPDGTTYWVDGMFVTQTAGAPAGGSNEFREAPRSKSGSNDFSDGGFSDGGFSDSGFSDNEFSDAPASTPAAPPSFGDEPPLEDDDVRYDADDFGGGEFSDDDSPF